MWESDRITLTERAAFSVQYAARGVNGKAATRIAFMVSVGADAVDVSDTEKTSMFLLGCPLSGR